MTIDSIKFPIIVLKKGDSMVYTFSNKLSFTRTSEELLKIGIWDNCEIIDSNQISTTITDVRVCGYTGLWGWNPFLKGKGIIVDFDFSNEKQIDLEVVKQRVTLHTTQRSTNVETDLQLNDILQNLLLAKSIEEIVLILR
jgi:hypothetical protein